MAETRLKVLNFKSYIIIQVQLGPKISLTMSHHLLV